MGADVCVCTFIITIEHFAYRWYMPHSFFGGLERKHQFCSNNRTAYAFSLARFVFGCGGVRTRRICVCVYKRTHRIAIRIVVAVS